MGMHATRSTLAVVMSAKPIQSPAMSLLPPSGGALVHEGTFYKTLTDIEKAGIKASFVPGSHQWGRPDEGF